MYNGTGKFLKDYGKAIGYGITSGAFLGLDIYYGTKFWTEKIDGSDILPVVVAGFIAGGTGTKCFNSVRDTYKSRKLERKRIKDLVQATQ